MGKGVEKKKKKRQCFPSWYYYPWASVGWGPLGQNKESTQTSVCSGGGSRLLNEPKTFDFLIPTSVRRLLDQWPLGLNQQQAPEWQFLPIMLIKPRTSLKPKHVSALAIHKPSLRTTFDASLAWFLWHSCASLMKYGLTKGMGKLCSAVVAARQKRSRVCVRKSCFQVKVKKLPGKGSFFK